MTTREQWERLDSWNSAIEREFFAGQANGRPVYLDLEAESLERIARTVDLAPATDAHEALVAALRPTLHPKPDGTGLFAEHLSRLASWRRRGSGGTPPFLAPLTLLSLVAEGMRSDNDFRATNYYGRLCIALGVDAHDDAVRQKVARGVMDDSHRLWDALNRWLLAHEGTLGLPTAYAFDYRVHVGIPMSQALVREGDRAQLRKMFAEYRLVPGQALARSDMARLLKAWLPDSPVSRGLARLVTDDEVLGRVADIASMELQAWDGSLPDRQVADERPGSLLVAGSKRTHPRPRLELYLVARAATGFPGAVLELATESTSHARAAVVDAGGVIRVTASDSMGWSEVENTRQLSMPDVLLAKLRAEGAGARFQRDPRRLVVLERDEGGHRYVEVGRAQLGEDLLVLCHESLVCHLEPLLVEVARPGYGSSQAAELAGLPEGWRLYEHVEIMGLASSQVVDLAPLVPLSWTQVSLGGGFSLPGRATWLRESVPEVRASSFVEGLVTASIIDGKSAEGEPRELRQFTGSTVISLDSLELADGEYRIVLNEGSSGGTTLSSRGFSIRSASHPREVVDPVRLAHALSDGWGVLSAAESAGRGEVAGAVVSAPLVGDLRGATGTGDMPPNVLVLGALDAGDSTDHAVEGPAPAQARGGDAPVCLLGGAHHFILEDAPRRPRWVGDIGGTCKHCGLEKWFPARPAGRRGGFQRRGRSGRVGGGAVVAPAALEGVAPIRSRGEEGFDRLLDALCYARFGRWETFVTLASNVSDDPWFAGEAARLLSSLGHIDLELDRSTLRPLRWAVAPSALAVLPKRDAAVLCGHRSHELIATLRSSTTAAGGELRERAYPKAPLRLEVAGLTVDALARVSHDLSSAGLPLRLAAAAVEIAMSLPPLQDVVSALPVLHRAPDVKAECFDFERNAWLPIDTDSREAGTYRFLTRPLIYASRSADGDGFVMADNRLAKWLGANSRGLGLLAYDPASATLRCPLGAQLPGLLERALVLCSGEPPTQLEDGTVAYHDVPGEVAAAVWAAARSLTVHQAAV